MQMMLFSLDYSASLLVRVVDTRFDHDAGMPLPGKVGRILTNSNTHPHGIKVRLDDGKPQRFHVPDIVELSANVCARAENERARARARKREPTICRCAYSIQQTKDTLATTTMHFNSHRKK